MRRIFLRVGLGITVLLGSVTNGIASGWDDRGSRQLSEPSFARPLGQSSSFSSGILLWAEVREEKGYTIYRNEPGKKQSGTNEEEERRKEEKSWEMLRNLIIIPHRHTPTAPSTPSPSPGPTRPQ
jgi:hypothetical protein